MNAMLNASSTSSRGLLAWLNPLQAEEFEWAQEVTPFSNIAWPVGGGLMYLLMIYALHNYMKDRKALNVATATRFHNCFLVVLSIVLSCGIWVEVLRFGAVWNAKTHAMLAHHETENPEQFLKLMVKASEKMFSVQLAVPWYNLNCHKWCILQPEVQEQLHDGSAAPVESMEWCDVSANPLTGRLYWWIYMAYLWKYYDFVDTVLLVLKKKNLIFLHVFHHATVPLCAWMAFEGRLLMPLWMGMGINSVVHGLMYYYYYLRECGIQVWWRRLVTQIQTSQFVLGAIMTLYGVFHFFKMPTIVISDSGLPWFSYSRGCDAESWAIYTCGAFNLAFLFLFMHWYVTTYNMPKKARATLSGHEKTC